MLEGKELVYKLGEYGEASLDINSELEVEVQVAAKYKASLKDVLKAYVAKTPSSVDDKILQGALSLLALLEAKGL